MPQKLCKGYLVGRQSIIAVLRSRGSTKRSKALPLGDDSAPSVALGNTMVARCALLLFLAAARGIWFVLEQPRGSLLEYHPAMQRVLKLVRVWRKHVRMGDFAAPTEKGIWLYSSPGLTCLAKHIDPEKWVGVIGTFGSNSSFGACPETHETDEL